MSGPNRLQHESSPYLLQHAHNPVDWYPWGEEALRKAQDENKPILVSIGYSSCHWCHVMERESFENPEVARLMNAGFVCIKVDREERPDVDAVYMDAVQAMGVRGGWPLNVFLLPDTRPFYGLTYLPPPQWMQLLRGIEAAFRDNYQDLQQSAAGFVANLQLPESEKYSLSALSSGLSVDELDLVFERLKTHFDTEKGGMDRAPKFPMPAIFKFLLRYYDTTQNPEALRHIEHSLNRIALGGLYDHVGGGWARYSVDADWFIPHFEKMLYDNGQLLSIYSEAFSLTANPLYENRIHQTIRWLETEMLSETGGFYAALDADSEGMEGKFYIWTAEALKEALGTDYDWFARLYQVSEAGNWEDGYNHLHLTQPPAQTAAALGIDLPDFDQRYQAALQQLEQVRSSRIRPGLDDKLLASWNGLALKGLTDAYRATGKESIRELALRNGRFIVSGFIVPCDEPAGSARLYHTFKNGKATIAGFLEDYAAVAEAFTALYQITFDETWLWEARKLIRYVLDSFFNETEGFFYFTDRHSEALIARKTELFDNVIPASNSMLAHVLYTLGTLLDDAEYLALAHRMAGKMVRLVNTDAQWVANWAALHCLMSTSTAEIVITGPGADAARKDLDRFFIPNKVVMGDSAALPLAQDKTSLNNAATLYVCYDKTCQLPVNSVEAALKLIATA